MKLNTRVFPDGFNTWDSLGEAYAEVGRERDALRAFERSLELNPENESARARIEGLRGGGGQTKPGEAVEGLAGRPFT